MTLPHERSNPANDGPPVWGVSVKAVFGPPGAVVLLHNERNEWELPGGRLDLEDLSMEECLRREVDEELQLDVGVDSQRCRTWIYEPLPHRRVVIVSYACALVGEWPDTLTFSHEHDDVGVFSIAELASLELPRGYRDDIAALATR